MAHLHQVVQDEYIAEQVLALARKGRFTLDEEIPTNEERAAAGQVPSKRQRPPGQSKIS